jgi:hypothetical protein
MSTVGTLVGLVVGAGAGFVAGTQMKGPNSQILGAGIGGLLGAGIGALATAAAAQAAPTPTPTPIGPSPAPPTPPLPPGAAFTTPITDPNMVRQYQTIVANAFATDPTVSATVGLTPADYTSADVDGNPANPRWVRVVAAFQSYANTILPAALAAGKLPAGFPAQLRTDGVLDYATAILIANA